MDTTYEDPEEAPAEAPAGDSGGVGPAKGGATEDVATETEVPEPAATGPEVPLAIALLQQTRRVREQVLPAYYALRYRNAAEDEARAGSSGVAPAGGGATPRVNPEFAITLMNGALSTAEQAMMNQDASQMIFAYHQLATYGV